MFSVILIILSKLVKLTKSSKINVKRVLTILYRVFLQTALRAAYLVVIRCLYLIVDVIY